jgi:hypothetical protein
VSAQTKLTKAARGRDCQVRLYHAEGVMRTQDILIREGKVAS